MDPTIPRPSRRDDRPRAPRGGAVAAILGLLIASGTRQAPADGGAPPAPQQAADAPKAQVATAPPDSTRGARRLLEGQAPHPVAPSDAESIARARRVIADCKARYLSVRDYTCTFFKRERVEGKLYATHVIAMKARSRPESVYFKFIRPNAGREAIYIHGQNAGKIVAHDVGLGRLVAGTMHLDPKGDMAMEENRHPVTEAGLGSMIDTVQRRWDAELRPGASVLAFHPRSKVGDRSCLMIESIHPERGKDDLFFMVKLYVDDEFGLPIRFEAYDWPGHAGAEPELMEEYTYVDLRINVGLTDRDFDPRNSRYSYGRF